MSGQIYKEFPKAMKWKKYIIFNIFGFCLWYYLFNIYGVFLLCLMLFFYAWLSITIALILISESITNDAYNWSFLCRMFWYMVEGEIKVKSDYYDIYDWCRENIEGGWYLISRRKHSIDGVQMAFKNEHDAVAFKLRWG
jgi:hypothetical protein